MLLRILEISGARFWGADRKPHRIAGQFEDAEQLGNSAPPAVTGSLLRQHAVSDLPLSVLSWTLARLAGADRSSPAVGQLHSHLHRSEATDSTQRK